MRQLSTEFANPSNELGLTPFWFLNEKLEEKELSWQIKEMYRKGLRGFVMHARYGLEIPYLSKKWFEKIEYIVKEAEKLGMEAIIYDEVDWPSGMAGTKVLDDHPEYAMKYLDISWIRCDNKKSVDVFLESGKVINIIGAKFKDNIKQEDYKFEVTHLTSLISYVKDHSLKIENMKDIDIIFIFIEKEFKDDYHPQTAFPQPTEHPFHQPHGWDWYFPYGKYVDLLNPEAVNYFLKVTHEEYKKRFKDYFGKTITKFFTDEPGFYTIMNGKNSAVPWSSILPSEFEKEFGYSVIDYLPALIANIGDISYKVRHDFWYKLTKMFETNYVKKVSNWCEKNNLQLMGHFRLCNPFLIWQMQYQGNVINDMRQMQIPGVDSLDNAEGGLNLRWGKDENVWQIPNKILSSVGHLYGKRKVMSESFALGGWKYRLEDMKILTDWQCMLGINHIVPHAFHYSIVSQRKRECPPSQFYQNPMWESYGYYSKYFRRISTMITDSDHVADIALLFPMESLWAEYLPGTIEKFPWNINDDFSYITDKLLRIHMDYDILDQDTFEECKINDGKLEIRNEKYSILILPPMTTIRDKASKKIVEFIRKGGKVLVLSLLPYKNNEGDLLEELNTFFGEEFGLNKDELISDYKNIDNTESVKVLESKHFGSSFCLIKGGPLYKLDSIDLINNSLENMKERDIDITFLDGIRGNIYYSHWRRDGKEIFFVINSDEKAYKLEISFRDIGKPYVWDPETGKIDPLYIYRIENKRLIIRCDLRELQSNFIVIERSQLVDESIIRANVEVINAENKNDGKRVITFLKKDEEENYLDIVKAGETKHIKLDIQADKIKKLKDSWFIKRMTPNVLVINKWEMMQGFSEGSGWFNMLGGTVVIESNFYVEGYGNNIKAIFDRIPKPNEIAINDKVITNFSESSYLDHQMKEVDLKDIIKIGNNKVRISFELKERAFQGKTGITPVEIMYDPVLIIGDFKLVYDSNQPNSYVIAKEEREIKTGSWTKQGYPYLAGCMELIQRVYIENDFIENRKIFLKSNNIKEIAELHINDRIVGLRPWKPYVFDITNYLKPGENLVSIKVWNTLSNLLDLKILDSGIVDSVYLTSKEIRKIEI